MSKTSNYQLTLWDWEDEGRLEEINENFSKLDANAVRMVTGSYMGDGALDRTIELGITPLAILVEDHSGYQGQNTYTRGLALREYPLRSELLSIVEGGFRVRDRTSGSQFNAQSAIHYYIALY